MRTSTVVTAVGIAVIVATCIVTSVRIGASVRVVTAVIVGTPVGDTIVTAVRRACGITAVGITVGRRGFAAIISVGAVCPRGIHRVAVAAAVDTNSSGIKISNISVGCLIG